MMPNAGQTYTLGALVAKAAATVPILNLYQNNYTPAETDTGASFTAASFTGYAAVSMSTGASWTTSGGNPTTMSYTQQTFTCSSTGTTQQIYGYYVTATTSGTLLWSERFSDGPYPITNTGDNIKITPTITCNG